MQQTKQKSVERQAAKVQILLQDIKTLRKKYTVI
ncbi:hypothetical protein YFHUAIHA_CDS0094 [Phage C48C1]|nr:hypothetical protein YFHUAIHA_CDS0094 [Phage C48C1]